MKKILLLFLCVPALLHADDNLHRYMWANYRQFGGQTKQASEWYDAIFASDQPPVFSNKGYIHLLSNQRNYKRIVELIPKLDAMFAKDTEIQLIFVSALKHTGNVAESDRRLFRLSKQFTAHPEIAFHAAEALLRKKELTQALGVVDGYLNQAPRRPNNFIFHFLKSQIYTKLNNFKQAQESINQCLEAHPKFPQGWLLFALIQEQAGKINKAIEGYTSYLEVAGSNKQIEQHLLGLVLKQKAISQNKQVILMNRSCFEKAVILFERKEYRGALKQVESCLLQNPTDTKMRLLKVEILTAMKEYKQVTDLLVAWTIEGTQTHIWLQALHLLPRAGTVDKQMIVSALEKIHTHQPRALLPVLLLGDMYTRLHKPDNAYLYHQKALALSTHNELKARILYQMALIQYDKQEYSGMQQTLEHAVSLGTQYPPALNLLAYQYATDGKHIKKAVTYNEQALEKDPHNPHFLDTKAVLLYHQGHYKQAAHLLEKVVARIPRDSAAQMHLAQAYHRMGKIKKACETIGTAQQCAVTPYEKKITTTLASQWKK